MLDIWKETFKEGDIKVKADDHITGKYGGLAHQDHNINLTLTKKLYVVFHNLKNCYFHLIFQ